MKTNLYTEETTTYVKSSTQQYIIQPHLTHDTGFTYAFDSRIILPEPRCPFLSDLLCLFLVSGH